MYVQEKTGSKYVLIGYISNKKVYMLTSCWIVWFYLVNNIFVKIKRNKPSLNVFMVDFDLYLDSLQCIDSKKCKDAIWFAKEFKLIEKWTYIACAVFWNIDFFCLVFFCILVILSFCIFIGLSKMLIVIPTFFSNDLFGCLVRNVYVSVLLLRLIRLNLS